MPTKSKKPSEPLITEFPVTAEAREAMLSSLFSETLTHPGELFIPNDDFYISGTTTHKAEHMVKELCLWLGIKPGYIGLAFESKPQENPDGRRYTIFLELETLHDEFVLGGFLAYALTRYLIEEQKHIHLQTPEQQGAILASASIVFGLGVVVINGITPSYGYADYFRTRNHHVLRSFPLPNYTHMLRNFLKRSNVVTTSYDYCLTPWAQRRLMLPPAKRPIHAVVSARHRWRTNTLRLAGLAWISVMVIGIGSFVMFQRVRPVPVEIRTAEQGIKQLQSQVKTCNEQLAYDRQYTDTSDIQASRVLNAKAVECKSLRNQLDAAEQEYRSLINR